MGINDLPKPGINFRATVGPGNFKKKLSHITRHGDLINLQDNQKEIVEVAKDYQRYIKVKGGLSRLQRRDAWLKIKAGDATVTKEDRREIKQVLVHLGRGSADAEEKKAPEGFKLIKTSDGKSHLIEKEVTPIKTSDGKGFLTKRQIDRNKLSRMQRDESALEEGGHRANISVLGKVGGGVKGTAVTRFGLGGQQSTGFAGNWNNNKINNSEPPKSPLGG